MRDFLVPCGNFYHMSVFFQVSYQVLEKMDMGRMPDIDEHSQGIFSSLNNPLDNFKCFGIGLFDLGPAGKGKSPDKVGVCVRPVLLGLIAGKCSDLFLDMDLP